jgi:hypothetical protein
LLVSPGSTIARLDETGGFQETRFWVGCQPGPFHPPPWPDPMLDHAPPPEGLSTLAIRVDLDSAPDHRPILGAGFNFEHTLWSCPAYRNVFDSELLHPFQPAIARVDSGLPPAAPDYLPATELTPGCLPHVPGGDRAARRGPTATQLQHPAASADTRCAHSSA